MPRLVFREVELWRAGGAAGVAIKHKGETLCIDAPSAEGCRHLFYTHSHPSHYPGGVQEFYSPFGGRLVKPGDVLEVGLFVIHVVDAYNITKLRGGKPVHPRGEGVGYVVEAGGVRIYHTGDTDLIREMASAAPIDILILPIGGETVMTPEEAADAVMLLRPKIAIPIHYSHQKQYVKFRDIAHPYTNIIAL